MSFFAVHRGSKLDHLLEHDHNAYILASHIANRARWNDDWNAYGLVRGQALIGDVAKMGMTSRTYRTAKQNLEKYGIATFKATNKGTIATLCESTISIDSSKRNDNQEDKHPTSTRQAPDKQEDKHPTTNIHNTYKHDHIPTPSKVVIEDDDGDVIGVCPDFLDGHQWSFLQSIYRTGKLHSKTFPPESWKTILRNNPEFDCSNEKHTSNLLVKIREVEGQIKSASHWFKTWMPKFTTPESDPIEPEPSPPPPPKPLTFEEQLAAIPKYNQTTKAQ